MNMRKKNVISLILVLIVGAVFLIPQLTVAETGQTNDPLVTRSFVEEQIAQVMGIIANMHDTPPPELNPGSDMPPFGGTLTDEERHELFAELLEAFDVEFGALIRLAVESGHLHAPPPPEIIVSDRPCPTPWTPLFVESGTLIRTYAGTEVIVRSGRAIVVAGVNGIVDATGGRDVGNGQTVSNNHLMMTPASDGRSFYIVDSAWIMIRGEHTLVS